MARGGGLRAAARRGVREGTGLPLSRLGDFFDCSGPHAHGPHAHGPCDKGVKELPILVFDANNIVTVSFDNSVWHINSFQCIKNLNKMNIHVILQR